MHFWPFYCYFCPFCHFRCKMMKNAFLRSKKAKIEKSEESVLYLFFDFTYITLIESYPKTFLGGPLGWENECFWSCWLIITGIGPVGPFGLRCLSWGTFGWAITGRLIGSLNLLGLAWGLDKNHLLYIP